MTPPPDVPVCEQLSQYQSKDPATGHIVLKPSPACMKAIGEASCGHCTTVVTGTQTYVGELPGHTLNKKKWSEVKAESLYFPAVESVGPLEKNIVDNCKTFDCSDAVTPFTVKLNSLNGIISLIKGL